MVSSQVYVPTGYKFLKEGNLSQSKKSFNIPLEHQKLLSIDIVNRYN